MTSSLDPGSTTTSLQSTSASYSPELVPALVVPVTAVMTLVIIAIVTGVVLAMIWKVRKVSSKRTPDKLQTVETERSNTNDIEMLRVNGKGGFENKTVICL